MLSSKFNQCHLNLGSFLLGASGSVRARVYNLVESHPSHLMEAGRFCTCGSKKKKKKRRASCERLAAAVLLSLRELNSSLPNRRQHVAEAKQSQTERRMQKATLCRRLASSGRAAQLAFSKPLACTATVRQQAAGGGPVLA